MKCVKHFLLSIFFVLNISIFAYADTLIEYEVPIPFGGENNKTDSLKIKDVETPDSDNIYIDERDVISKRKGYTVYCNLPATGTVLGGYEYTRSNGEKWLEIQISSTIYATKDNGLTWITVISNLSIINPINYTTYLDESWHTNGFDNVFTWNTSTTTSYGFIPKGKYIETHFDQIFVANTNDNNSSVYFSDVWLGPKNQTAWQGYNVFNVNQNDGDIITGMKSFGGNIVIFKGNSIWGILGYGNDMNLTKYPGDYGCISQKSIQNYKLDLYFLSKKGLCKFNNGYIKQIDRNIENYTKNAKITIDSSVNQIWKQSTHNEYITGTSSNVAIFENYLSLDQSAIVNFNNSEIYILKNFYTGNPIIATYESNKTVRTGGAELTLVETTPINFPASSNPGNYRLQKIALKLAKPDYSTNDSTVTVYIKDYFGELISKDTVFCGGFGTATWYTFFSTFAIIVPRTVIISASFAPNPEFKNYLNYAIYVNQIITQAYNEYYTSYYTTQLLADEAIVRLKSYGWIFSRQWIVSAVGITNYVVEMWRDRSTLGDIKYLAIQCQYYLLASATGYYVSKKFDVGSKISQWKYFITSSYGELIYNIRYATFSASSVFDNYNSSWTTINNGDIIQATTMQRYVQWRVDFDNEHKKLYVISVGWYEGGAGDNQDCSSAIFDNRYYISFSTYSTTNNLTVFLDNYGGFFKWTGPNIGCFLPYNNNLYFSNSVSDYRLYKFLDGYNDLSNAVTSYYKTKYLDFGLDEDKRITQVGITAKGSGTLVFGYRNNYSTTFSTRGITLTSEPDNFVYNLPMTSQAKFWQFKFSNNSMNEWFDIVRFKIYGTKSPLRPR